MNNPVNVPPAGQRQPGLVLHGVRHRDLRFLGLRAGLVAKLNERHQHGQHEAADEDVEYPGHVTEGQLALRRRLFLFLAFRPEERNVMSPGALSVSQSGLTCRTTSDF